MADLGTTINVNEIPERQEFTPLPPGDYACMITASEMKPTKNGAGEYLELSIEVQDGQFANRKLFERLNLKNANPDAERIAYESLGELCRAMSKTTIKDSNELHNKRFVARVEVEQGKPYTKDGVTKEGSAQNRIKKYLNISGSAPATNTNQPQAAAVSSAQDAALPPWKRKA